MQEFRSDELVAVFVQAPADTGYAFTICDLEINRGARVLLIVVHVRSLYEYLLGIPLGTIELHFVPYLLQPLPRTPRALYRVREEMASHFAAVFGERQVIRAYFSCAQFDAVTPYFLRRLQKDARIFLYDHYHMPEVREKRWIPRLAAKWLILRFVTGVSFGFCKETLDSGSDTIWRTTFDAGLLNAREIVISPKWSCLPLPPISAPFVIIMDSNDEPSPFGYADLMGDLIANLRSRNINIVLKAHPRSGCSPFLSKFNLPELPAGCPIELFDIHDVAAVIGITSLGLAAVAQLGHTAVSLLYLLRFRDEDSLEFWREWMDRHSGGKIRFPKSFSALLPMIEAFST